MKRRRSVGQSLVEFSLIVPIIATLMLATVELGLALDTNMSLVSATREGARVGALLGNGADVAGGSAMVDPYIVAAVERALQSKDIDVSRVDWIHIYQVKPDGTIGPTNAFKYSKGKGTVVDGAPLDFVPDGAMNWDASKRSSAPPIDSVGVSLHYTYSLITPLSALAGVFGGSQIPMTDATVMAVEP